MDRIEAPDRNSSHLPKPSTMKSRALPWRPGVALQTHRCPQVASSLTPGVLRRSSPHSWAQEVFGIQPPADQCGQAWSGAETSACWGRNPSPEGSGCRVEGSGWRRSSSPSEGTSCGGEKVVRRLFEHVQRMLQAISGHVTIRTTAVPTSACVGISSASAAPKVVPLVPFFRVRILGSFLNPFRRKQGALLLVTVEPSPPPNPR